MAFDKKLLEILACPVCKGKLTLSKDGTALISRFERLSYPIIDGIPVLIESEATRLSAEELEELSQA
jgi:uncharacterized protein YbaR (Trm112 family)